MPTFRLGFEERAEQIRREPAEEVHRGAGRLRHGRVRHGRRREARGEGFGGLHRRCVSG